MLLAAKAFITNPNEDHKPECQSPQIGRHKSLQDALVHYQNLIDAQMLQHNVNLARGGASSGEEFNANLKPIRITR